MPVQVSPDLPHTDDLIPVRPWLLRLLRPLFVLVIRRRWKVAVHGRDQLPAGPVIFAANHIGVLDGPLLVALIGRDAYAMAKQELFAGWLGRALLLVGQVPIDRRRPDPGAMRRCVRLLRDGHALVVYPEGIRGLGDVARMRAGAAYLALVTGAPIVPVALLGTRQPGQTTAELPSRGAPIHVVFGAPFALPQQPWPRRQSDVARWSEDVRVRLAEHVAAAQASVGLTLPGPARPRQAPVPTGPVVPPGPVAPPEPVAPPAESEGTAVP